MMNGAEGSDLAIVAMKPANKSSTEDVERAERRAGTEETPEQQSIRRTQSRESVTQALGRIRQAARSGKGEKFTSLFHHISPEMLMTAYYALSRKAAAGVDGMKWAEYGQNLEARLLDLHERVQQGRYVPQPARRTYIPKADGRQRPLAVAALEDKIVQGALVMILNVVYEEHFLGFSYGFRPGRGPHDALDALAAGIDVRKVFTSSTPTYGTSSTLSVKIGSSDSWNTASATDASSASSANG